MNIFIALFARLVAEILGIHVTSWIRTPEHNAEIGGVPNSFHLSGLALDFSADTSAQTVQKFVSLTGWQIVDERSTASPHWHVEHDGPLKGAAVLGGFAILVIILVVLFRKG